MNVNLTAKLSKASLKYTEKTHGKLHRKFGSLFGSQFILSAVPQTTEQFLLVGGVNHEILLYYIDLMQSVSFFKCILKRNINIFK